MRKMIICNHKMYLNLEDSIKLNDELKKLDFSFVDLIICPNYLDFDIFRNFPLGAQDAYFDNGPYTSMISAYALSERKIQYCLVGHGFLRKHDSNKIINKKLKAIIDCGMTPILCIGDTKEEYEKKETINIIKKQLKKALKDVNTNSHLIISYEPIWSICTGEIMPKSDLEKIISAIRNIIRSMGFTNYKLVYGGSVTSKTIAHINQLDVDGYIVGASSTNVEELKKIINYTQKV